MQEFLDFLQDWRKDREKHLNEFEVKSLQRLKMHRSILKSKKSSEAEKVNARLSIVFEYTCLRSLISESLIWNHTYILAKHVQILGKRINNLKERLAESGIKERDEDVQKLKKLEDEIASLKTEWQPYIDAFKRALDSTKRYFEDNR